LREHFKQYGRVEDVEWPLDKVSKTRKSFAFVVFETEDAVEKAAAQPKQHFANREVFRLKNI
jgi:RNA recognition motif-containing protein